MGMIFLLFVILNGLYLFEWPSFDYFMPFLISMVLLIIFHLVITVIFLKSRLLLKSRKFAIRFQERSSWWSASTLGSISIYSNTLEFTNNAQDINLPKKLQDSARWLCSLFLISSGWLLQKWYPSKPDIQNLTVCCTNCLKIIKFNLLLLFRFLIKEIVVEEKLRNNVFLIFEGNTHNILKHTQKKRVVFEVKFLNDFCFLFH